MYQSTLLVLLLAGCTSAFQSKIVNGIETNITEVPYQVSLQNPLGKHWCGGAIISHKLVLTAAHCDRIEVDSYVVAGMTRSSIGGVAHDIEEICSHPNYGNLANDIALIKTRTPFEYNERVQPVLLPKDDQPLPVGSKCTVAGWGQISQYGPVAETLQKTDLEILDPEYCSQKYDGFAKYFIGPEATMMCAGVEYSLRDTCVGDSGGSLVCDGIAYGLVSFGYGCANRKYPKVFTNVYNFRKFIYAQVHFE